jgi:hypothetical protein
LLRELLAQIRKEEAEPISQEMVELAAQMAVEYEGVRTVFEELLRSRCGQA